MTGATSTGLTSTGATGTDAGTVAGAASADGRGGWRGHEPVEGWTPPSAAERLALLQRTRSVAMVGVSANPARPSNFVATYLCSSSTDFDVYFVNPRADEILGRPCYDSLADLPVAPDLVDVFRRPDDLPAVAAEAVEVGAAAFWVQLGLWSAPAAKLAHEAGLDVVMDRCLKIEHARFAGGLHLGGFDTGVVDSRRQIRREVGRGDRREARRAPRQTRD